MLKICVSFNLLFISSAFFFEPRRVCYHPYGCFSAARPFNNALGNIPDSPSSQRISFEVFTRQNQDNGQLLAINNQENIRASDVKINRKTILIIHGYHDNGGNTWVMHMKNKILSRDDCNVISVNWDRGAAKLNYFKAAANTRVVGAVIARLIREINVLKSVPFNQFHVIGHSLGAHIAGYVGEIISGLGRITGLDPAGLAFERFPTEVRLDPSDAKYVDVIHTDGGSLTSFSFGSRIRMGDVDFYPNGGQKQPGCTHYSILLRDPFGDIASGLACSHMRAIELFTASLDKSCQYRPCSSKTNFNEGRCDECGDGCVIMGYYSSLTARGTYYLRTNSTKPYC